MHAVKERQESSSKFLTLEKKAKDFKGLIYQKGILRKQILGIVVVFAIAIGSILLSQRLLQPVGEPGKSFAQATVPWTYPRKMRVIVLRYFDPSSQPAYRDPVTAQQVTETMQGFIRRASIFHGSLTATPAVEVEVVDTYDYQEAAPGSEVPWEEAYKTMLARPLTHAGDNNRTLCERIVSDNVDQIWFMADSSTGRLVKGPEFAISSRFVGLDGYINREYQMRPQTQFCNGAKSFSVMYLDLSRAATSLHPFGHYMEAVLSSVQTFELFDKRYMGVGYASDGMRGTPIAGITPWDVCGSVHVPPNTELGVDGFYTGYLYEGAAQVQSSCANWKPDGTGQKVTVNSGTWNNSSNFGTPENKYLTWWMQNMPNIGNTLSYNGLPLPNWWDFVVDTDNTIMYYLGTSTFMNPGLWSAASTGTTVGCVARNGTTTTCTFDSTTLGASTAKEDELLDTQVLQASTGPYGNMALVTVAYRSPSLNFAKTAKVTYCGQTMLPLGTPSAVPSGVVDLWYLLNPTNLNCKNVVVEFRNSLNALSDPGERVVSKTVFNNVDQTNPIQNVFNRSGPGGGGVGTISIASTGDKDTMLECGVAGYPNGSLNNPILVSSKSRELWRFYNIAQYGNIYSLLVSSYQRSAGGENMEFRWTTNDQQPWVASCANIRIKAQVSPIAPSASPIATPAPIPAVDLKVNNSNGPLTIASGSSATLSWTSSNVTSCTASGSWSGSKTTTGSISTGAVTSSRTYTIVCTGPNNAQASDSVTVNVQSVAPMVDLKINGSDGVNGGVLVLIETGPTATLSWTSSNVTSCTASGSWSGARATSGSEQTGTLVIVASSGPHPVYTITCVGTNGVVVSDSLILWYNATGQAGGGGGVVTPTPSPTPVTVATGLFAEYFDNKDFTNLKFSRVDTNVDANWLLGSPNVSLIGGDTYSVRWSGYINITTAGAYTFYAGSDDGGRLTIDNSVVVDNWRDQAYTERSGVVTLSAGLHALKYEFYENTGNARVTLAWSGPNISKQIIPVGSFRTNTTVAPTATPIQTSTPTAPPATVAPTQSPSVASGLLGEYFDNKDFTNLKFSRVDGLIDANWLLGSPNVSLIGADTYSVRWTGYINIPSTGVYTFYAGSDDGSRLTINNTVVVNNFSDHAYQEVSGQMTLNAGFHAIKYEFYESTGNARATLSWSGPNISKQIVPASRLATTTVSTPAPTVVPTSSPTSVSSAGLVGEYFDNKDFTNLKFSRVDGVVDANWLLGSPSSSLIGVDTYSVRWSGYITVPVSGTYTFYLGSDDGTRLKINGNTVVNNWYDQAYTERSGTVSLNAGRHPLIVEYYENTGNARVGFGWSGPNVTKQLVPASVLSH